jgi:hypothetical protein
MKKGELIAEGDSVVFEVNRERMSIITAHKSTCVPPRRKGQLAAAAAAL